MVRNGDGFGGAKLWPTMLGDNDTEVGHVCGGPSVTWKPWLGALRVDPDRCVQRARSHTLWASAGDGPPCRVAAWTVARS